MTTPPSPLPWRDERRAMGLGCGPGDNGGGRNGARHLVPVPRRRADPAGISTFAMPPDDLDRLAVPDARRAVTVDVVTSRSTSTRRPHRPPTPTCGCRHCRTGCAPRTPSTSTASSATFPTSPGPTPGRCILTTPTRLRPFLSATASRCRGSTSSRACSTTSRPRACGSPTRRACGWAPTSPPAPRSCTKAS